MSNPFFKNYGPIKISYLNKHLNLKTNNLDIETKINDIKDLTTASKKDITFFDGGLVESRCNVITTFLKKRASNKTTNHKPSFFKFKAFITNYLWF